MSHKLEIVDGKLYASGNNEYGQLGSGNNKSIDTEVLVLTNTISDSIKWISASAGLHHSIAVKEDKSIWVWGSNVYGQVGEPRETKYIATPKKLTISVNIDKDIEIKTGYQFSTIAQTSEKAYGIGSYQNFADNFVGIYREPTPLYYLDPTGDKWLTINVAAKTLVGRPVGGNTVFSDWSGDLFTKDYTTFERLNVGDFFTLDSNDRNRVIYKKVDKYQRGEGCCKTNALCTFRKYIELKSSTDTNIIDNQKVASVSISDILSDNNIQQDTVTSEDQYGTDFTFESALGSLNYINGFVDSTDPFKLKAMYSITGTSNNLDLILADSLYFSENTTETFNIKTPVQRINAREVFQKTNFPPYLLEKGTYKILLGQYYRSSIAESLPTQQSVFPLYLFKLNPVTGEPYIWQRKTKFYLYSGLAKDIREIESSDDIYEYFYDASDINNGNPTELIGIDWKNTLPNDIKKTYTWGGPWPADENNTLLISNYILTEPYLIKDEIVEKGDSPLDRTTFDPYYRAKVQIPSQGLPACGPDPDKLDIDTTPEYTSSHPEEVKWPYSCNRILSGNSSLGIPRTTHEEISLGSLGKQLVEYYLKPSTAPKETETFFGMLKFELQELYDNVFKYPPFTDLWNPNPEYQISLESFRTLRDIINAKVKGKIYFDQNNKPLQKLGSDVLSGDEFISFLTPAVSFNNIGWKYTETKINIQQISIHCFTDRVDHKKILMSGPLTDKFQAGTTIIEYYVKNIDFDPSTLPDPSNWDPILAYTKKTASVNIISVKYEPKITMTVLTLSSSFDTNYKIGVLPDTLGRPSGRHISPKIYINNPLDLAYKLRNYYEK